MDLPPEVRKILSTGFPFISESPGPIYFKSVFAAPENCKYSPFPISLFDNLNLYFLSRIAGLNKYLPNQFHSSENYTSTLAHKLNHSFIANCEWSNAEHPCYGLVPSVTTFLDVQEGQELTINYGLDMEVAIWRYSFH